MKNQDKKFSTHHKRTLATMFLNRDGKPVSLDYIGKVLHGHRTDKAITDAYNVLVEKENETVNQLKERVSKFQNATI